jgi:riboflavin biosynthesis pyrimidine reductase
LGLIDHLSIVIAPVILGGGKRLFEGFSQDIELKHQAVRQSQYATIIDYALPRS